MSKRNAQITFDDRVGEWDASTPITKSGSHIKEGLAPGFATWCRNAAGKIVVLRFMCPCGCKEVASVPVDPIHSARAWKWDGNETAPTLKPSIQRLSKCHWHGYLTNGVFVEC